MNDSGLLREDWGVGNVVRTVSWRRGVKDSRYDSGGKRKIQVTTGDGRREE